MAVQTGMVAKSRAVLPAVVRVIPSMNRIWYTRPVIAEKIKTLRQGVGACWR